jgi:chromosome segregation ATPase
MASLEAKLVRIEEQLQHLRNDLAELARAIHGPNGSIRNRLHKLENDAHAARIAAETLAQVKRRQGEGFTKKQQIAVLVFGAVAALGTLVSVVVALSQLSSGG